MRKYLPTLSIFLMLFTLSANAQVDVAWIYNEQLPGNKSRLVRPSQAFIKQMRACRINPKLQERDILKFKQLDCPGLLDKSYSKSLQEQLLEVVREIPGPEAQVFAEEIRHVTFAFSHTAVFLSRFDAPGDGRFLAVNIPAMRLVVFNTIMWKKLESKEAQNFALLHEALVVLGYADHQYEISNNYIGHLPLKLSKPKKKMTGVYGFTHGGETNGATFKASLIQAIREDKLKINFDEKRIDKFRPSKQRILEVAEQTEVGLMSTKKLMELNLCNSFDGQQSGKEYCGHLALKGANGLPVLLMSSEWGTFKPQKKNHELLVKIYMLIYVQLMYEAGFK